MRLITQMARGRFYDSKAGKVVSLGGLFQIYSSGEKLNVVCRKSGKNLTRKTIRKIIKDDVILRAMEFKYLQKIKGEV